MPGLGKCPVCGKVLQERDIIDYEFRGTKRVHYIYVCRKCSSIIGFSAMT